MTSRSQPSHLPAGVRLIERGWLSANAVVFDDGNAIDWLDTGYFSHADQTIALARAATTTRPLRRILNTHLHSDHCGGNAALQSAFAAAQVWIPAGEAEAVSFWNEDALSFAATGQHCPRFNFHGLLRGGDVIRLAGIDWQIVAAPGHEPHMVMLYQPDHRVLITADALWENGFGALFPGPDGTVEIAEQAATLDLIETLAPEIILPGHGSPFHYEPAIVDRARQRLRVLSESPERNGRHVIKVLIKFHLLEHRRLTLPALVAHFATTRVFRQIHSRYFAQFEFAVMIQRAVDDLVTARALTRSEDHAWVMDHEPA